MERKIGIIGFGWVGKSMHKLFPNALIFDSNSDMLDAKKLNLASSMDEINRCDVAFVCVPTPNKKDGSLDSSIVEDIVRRCECPLIVIRSTVQPGVSDYLKKKYKRHIVTQPEYLGETPSHPMLDPRTRQFMILGGDPKDRRTLINIYTASYNANVSIRQVTNKEAEVIKLSENRAIAFKVAQCQELYDVCEIAGVDYYTVREAVYSDDPRFNLWFTFIYPEQRGFNSKCIPKDVYGWCAWAESLGYDPKLTRAMLKVNDKYINKK